MNINTQLQKSLVLINNLSRKYGTIFKMFSSTELYSDLSYVCRNTEFLANKLHKWNQQPTYVVLNLTIRIIPSYMVLTNKLTILNYLPLMNRLKHYRSDLQVLCCLCGKEEKMSRHLFGSCLIASGLIQKLNWTLKQNFLLPNTSIEDFLNIFQISSQLKVALNCILIHQIWLHRNNIIFGNNQIQPSSKQITQIWSKVISSVKSVALFKRGHLLGKISI